MHSYSTPRVFAIAVTAAAAICLIGPALAHAQNAQASTGGSATFTKDVAPIFQRACQNCHRPGSRRTDVASHLRGRPALGALH